MEIVMEGKPEEDFHPPRLVDAQLALADFDVEAVEQLALFEPYGQDNREPLFVTRGVFLRDARAVGAQKNHLSFKVTDGKRSASAIWFQCPCLADLISCDAAVDVVYRLQVDEFNGLKRVKLMVEQVYRTPSGDSNIPHQDDSTPHRDDGKPLRGDNLLPQNLEATIPELAAQIVGAPLQLHPAQSEALEALKAGKSVLAVMATGRGKSLIFQTHAARLALASKKASVFIYPLRALIADQYVHLADGFARLGLKACSLTGENTTEEKDRIFQGLYEGDIDALLTTPEFFRLHAWRFAQSKRVGFIVFDEAHHIQTERVSDRESYHDLRTLREHFPHARYLAVTATADDRITGGICRALGIERVIVDDTRRDNLCVDDARDLRDRELYLSSLVEQGGKMVIYVNSRAQAVDLTRLLRKRTSAQAESIVFYHAGLARAERQAIEEGFRLGRLRIIISTSAFGEGVNVPDIAHVVLYNLPFSAVAFNQMSGRAGRDGQEATVHFLYATADVAFNQRLLAPLAPGREELVTLYRVLRARAAATGGSDGVPGSGSDGDNSSTLGGVPGSSDGDAPNNGSTSGSDDDNNSASPPFTVSLKQLVQDCENAKPRGNLDERGVANGLAIFGELGLLWWEDDGPGGPSGFSDPGGFGNTGGSGDVGGVGGANRRITLAAAGRRVELSASSRYLEGREEFALFEQFKQWAFQASAEELREQLRGPLLPSADGQVNSHDR
jgi:single-stranded-DNA-specific exonuclease